MGIKLITNLWESKIKILPKLSTCQISKFSFRLNCKPCESNFDCLDIIAEPSNKGTMILFQEFLSNIHEKLYRSGFSSLSILDENIATLYFGLPFRRFHPFFESLNLKINQMTSAGLVDHWYKNAYDSRRHIKKVIEDIGPQVLTMDHVAIGFLVCLIPMTMSVIVCMFEISVLRIRKFVQHLTALHS